MAWFYFYPRGLGIFSNLGIFIPEILKIWGFLSPPKSHLWITVFKKCSSMTLRNYIISWQFYEWNHGSGLSKWKFELDFELFFTGFEVQKMPADRHKFLQNYFYLHFKSFNIFLAVLIIKQFMTILYTKNASAKKCGKWVCL